MTAARRQRKSRRQLIYFLALAGAGIVWPPGRLTFAATTERIVSDPSSGLAIGGFDPAPISPMLRRGLAVQTLN